MSFFSHVLATIGIGAAKVDTRLAKDTFQVGETISGVVLIQGGHVAQHIDNIYLYLMTQVIKEIDDKVKENTVLNTFKVTDAMLVQPNEKKEIPFNFVLPYETPISAGNTSIWIKTGLDVKYAIDPTDNDYIKVLPHPITDAVLNAVNELGFKLREVNCEISPWFKDKHPVVQEFEFVPTTNFRDSLDKLELIFLAHTDSIEVFIVIDKKPRNLIGILEEALHFDERYVRLKLSQNDIQRNLAEKLADHISNKIIR